MSTARQRRWWWRRVMSRRQMIGTMRLRRDGTEQWRQHQCDYRRKQRDTWTHYEVGSYLRVRIWTLTEVAMTASQMRIAETIDAFYGEAGAKDGVSRSYKQAVEDLDAETIKALDGPYRYIKYFCYNFQVNLSSTTVLEPISRFCAYFPDINECTYSPLIYIGHGW